MPKFDFLPLHYLYSSKFTIPENYAKYRYTGGFYPVSERVISDLVG